MPSLPFDLVENILSRLPVKPLKRFRCVAKPWHSLIDSERFAKSHLNMSLKTNSHRHLFVGDKKAVFTVDLDNEDPAMAKANAVKPPFSCPIEVSNSCNGLFLVLGKPLIIWNPFTKEIKKLPVIGDADSPPTFGCHAIIFHGFGYDRRNDDYKVLKVVSYMSVLTRAWISSVAHIYSLKSNSWKETAEKFTYQVQYNWPADVNGAMHTLLITLTQGGQAPGPVKVMAFSLETERHYEVKLPLGYSMKGVLGISIHKMGGCLSLASTISSAVEIWVMKDYGVAESWTKILSVPIRISMDLDLDVIDDDTVRPLVYSKDGNKVLMYLGSAIRVVSASGKSKGTILWHDLNNQPVVDFSLKEFPLKLDHFEACVETLVSLHGEQVQKQVQGHDKKDTKKIRKKGDDFLSKGFKLVL